MFMYSLWNFCCTSQNHSKAWIKNKKRNNGFKNKKRNNGFKNKKRNNGFKKKKKRNNVFKIRREIW